MALQCRECESASGDLLACHNPTAWRGVRGYLPARSTETIRHERTSGSHCVNRVGYQDRNADADKDNEEPIQKHVRLQPLELNARNCAQSKTTGPNY